MPLSKKVLALLLIGVFFTTARASQAQVGPTAFSIQQEHIHPQSYALGDATVAMMGGPGASQVNPAAIGTEGVIRLSSNVAFGSQEGPFFSSDFPSRFAEDTWRSHAAIDVQRGRWAGAYSFARNDLSGDLDRDLFDQFHKFTGAFAVTSSTYLGVGFNILTAALPASADGTRISSERKTSWSVDLGILHERNFKIEAGDITAAAGFSLTNFGPRFDDISQEDLQSALDTRTRTGLSLEYASDRAWSRRPVLRAGLHGAFSKRMQAFDDSLRAFGPFESLIRTWGSAQGVVRPDGERETVSLWEQLMWHGGAEVAFYEIAEFQVGRFFEHEANGGRQHTALGVALDLYYFRLEHARGIAGEAPFGELNLWRLTAQIPITSSERNFWPDVLDILADQ